MMLYDEHGIIIHRLLSFSTLHFHSIICILSSVVIVHFMNLAFILFHVKSNYFQELFDDFC
jgi:hypothetical protein